ncbi:MAG: hypothetical protein FGM45_06330, partial [Actinobacteria bacterium]|nr:hypothetical protein [Actinomycetota bacterium]
MPVLTPDMVRSSGASWPDVRSSALARVAAAPFPTTDLEHWRYSRIDELDLARFAPVDTPSTVTGGGADAVITRVATSAASADSAFTRLFPSNVDDLELFAALNLAHMDVIVVSVAANKVVSEPVVITHQLSDDGKAFFPRVVVEAGRNSEVTVVERF